MSSSLPDRRLAAADDPLPVSLTAPARPPNRLLDGPILVTLLRLASPNVISLSAGTCVVIAETSYIGRLGIEPLAAIALAFPFTVLTQNMSGGAMGGGASSAIARALGAGNVDRASALAIHAIAIAVFFGLLFTAFMLLFGGPLLYALGGRGAVLGYAMDYVYVLFSGATLIWLLNGLGAILRGTGNMKLPAASYLGSAILQVVLGGTLALGLGPMPGLGIRGVAIGMLIAIGCGTALMAWYIFSGRTPLKPTLRGFHFRREMFSDILKVGLISCFSPLQSVLSVMLLTSLLAPFGTEVLAGFGVGARLEILLGTMAYGVAVASVPFIGMNIGAGQIARARRIGWISGAVAAAIVGIIGGIVAIFPDLWIGLFTRDAGVREAGRLYLHIAGFPMAFLGLAIAMYFAGQGAARVTGPVLGQTARLVVVILGGWILTSLSAPVTAFFALAAVSMVIAGLLATLAVAVTDWAPPQLVGPKRGKTA